MFVLLNLKAYDCDPVAIAETTREVSEDSGVRIAVAPQSARLEAVAETGVETWAQHVAPVDHGSHTGSALADSAAAAGASGTLLNHSEKRRRLADIDGGLEAAERAGIVTVVCANNREQCKAVAAFGPDGIAIEPPALIGGQQSVSTADPDVVTEAVEAVGEIDDSIPVLCGAGISTGEDVESARDLGASGVLLASGVAKAEEPESVLRDLVAPVA
ncbi:triose-phosphate isomerase [Halobacteriales archaeon QH_8_64_26]|nr:MAG: triose-phosphate isomerase [Halobacteriales archaeon QH_8_64_26]